MRNPPAAVLSSSGNERASVLLALAGLRASPTAPGMIFWIFGRRRSLPPRGDKAGLCDRLQNDHVKICGFRGFRDKVRIDLGGGFTVIAGRNGVGKSTLCDAVEFAITGLIEKYAVQKAAKESLADCLWWRGGGEPEANYVTASFIGEDGAPFKITRTRESGADRSPEEIHGTLCSGPALDDALSQLTRTSIIATNESSQ